MGLTNERDLEWQETDQDDNTFRRKQLGEDADGEDLGCSLYELPPGKCSWLYHYHTANEEAVYVLDGTGTLRLDGEEHTLEPGVYAALPVGKRGCHQIVNGSESTLRYLMLSTMEEPDVTVYPEDEMIGVYAGSAPGRHEGRTVHGYYNSDDTVDYWE
jgi:uncharacterized cupin superfamily protein